MIRENILDKQSQQIMDSWKTKKNFVKIMGLKAQKDRLVEKAELVAKKKKNKMPKGLLGILNKKRRESKVENERITREF